MSEGPTEEQEDELLQRLIRVQRLATDPRLSNHRELFEDALTTAYSLSNNYAMMGMADLAVLRFDELQDLASRSPFGAATVQFPRKALLAARGEQVPEELHRECVSVVEERAMRRGS